MEKNHPGNSLPPPLSEIYEKFESVPENLLADSLTRLGTTTQSEINTYKELLSGLKTGIDKGTGEGQTAAEAIMKNIETFLDAVNSFLKKKTELSLDQVIGRMISEGREKINAAAGPTDEKYTRELDLDFWKKAETGSPGKNVPRLIKYYHYRIKDLAGRKKSKVSYGIQSYKPEELFLYFYFIPVIEKIRSLLGEFLSLQAKAFHELHLESETLIKQILAAEETNMHDPGGLVLEIHHIFDKIRSGEEPETEDLLIRLKKELDHFRSSQVNVLERKAGIAGTTILPESHFSSTHIDSLLAKIGGDTEIQSDQWDAYFEGEKDDWRKDVQVLKFAHLSFGICMRAKHQLTAKIESNVLPSLREASDAILSSIKKFSEQAKHEEGLRENILKESRSSLRKLRKETIPHITDQLNQAALQKVLSNIISLLRYRITSLNEEYSVIRNLELQSIPPLLRLQNISLKKIIKTEYFAPFSKNYSELSDKAEEFLSKKLRTLHEIGQIIEFNIESALEILDSPDDDDDHPDVQPIVEEGLQRARDILEETRVELETTPLSWWNSIKEMFIDLNRGVIDLSDNEKILNLQIREARAEAATRYRTYRETMAKQARQYLNKAWNWISYAVTGARSGYRQIGRLTGQLSLPELEREFMDLLYTTRKRIEKLPYVYQRLYRFDPLEDETLFGGREDDIEVIREKYELWKNGSFANTAVIGEKGSGRTTLLNLASKRIGKSNPLFRVRIRKGIRTEKELSDLFSPMIKPVEPGSLEDLRDALNDLENPVICMVEDLQFLFLRTLDGFDLVERFLWLISQSHRKVFWIVSIGSYGWSFLDVVISISRYFHHMIFLSQLEVDQIREIILKRHRISGFRLEFVPTPADLNDRRFRKLRSPEQQQKFLEEAFFKEIHAITKGNISVALLLWQLSVEEFKKDKVLIKSNLKLETNFLNDLPDEELFTLEALLEHELLTVKEYSAVFGENEDVSAQILNRMANKGLLVETQAGFQIHYMIYKPVVRTLSSKNILK